MIYLDNNSTTLLDSQVQQKMQHFLSLNVGNPSSTHRWGQKARAILAAVQNDIAGFFQVAPDELLFTSSATEALNTLIQGFCGKGHIISSALEHPSVIMPLKRLEKQGWNVTFLTPEPAEAGHEGVILSSQVEAAIRSDTRYIVLMAANNVVGTKTDIYAIAKIAKRHDIFFIVDAVALLGKEKIEIVDGISAIVFSGHKIHGPQGIGLAIVHSHLPFTSLLVGGNQEQGRRAGSENLLAMVGLQQAIAILQQGQSSFIDKMRALRQRFETKLLSALPDTSIHGRFTDRVVNTTSASFEGVDGESLLIGLDMHGVAASHGSACTSGATMASYVLLGLGLPLAKVRSTIRFSLSRMTTEDEIDRAIEIIARCVKDLRI